MTKSKKIIIAGLLALASATASASCEMIDDKGTVLCSDETPAIIEDEAANRVLLPAYELKTREFNDKKEITKCAK